jgi:putative transposase
LHEALRLERQKRPFELNAIVLLPDHVHTVWTLPGPDQDYSVRWQRIKETFTRLFLRAGGSEGHRSGSRTRHRERAIWQQRFWEHTCRDEADWARFLDYLHWNPVKHGLAARVGDYPWSSFHRFVERGVYDPNWGEADPCPNWDDPEWE